jgi:hypothetical protein
MRKSTALGLTAAAALAALVGAAPGAQAEAAPTAVVQATVVHSGTVHTAAARPGAVRPQDDPPNCVNPGFGYSGGQYYYTVSCGVIPPTIWWANVYCSNGITYSTGANNSFENAQVYCPVGTTPVEGWVTYE